MLERGLVGPRRSRCNGSLLDENQLSLSPAVVADVSRKQLSNHPVNDRPVHCAEVAKLTAKLQTDLDRHVSCGTFTMHPNSKIFAGTDRMQAHNVVVINFLQFTGMSQSGLLCEVVVLR